MANIFPRSFNFLPLKIALCLIIIGTLICVAVWYYFTPKYTRVGYSPVQPVAYSHALHVGQLGMDCRYCHSFVDQAAASNVPTTQTCMNCHALIQKDNPKLQPIRDSFANNKPIQWVRIHQVPDFAYFNHSVHIARGVSCVSCHGKINEMEVVYQHESQSMGWCLDCHRNPQNAVRPASQVFNLNWTPPADQTQQEIGQRIVEKAEIHPPQSCSGCHR
jgi:Cytochrome c7 and related cytochrome c